MLQRAAGNRAARRLLGADGGLTPWLSRSPLAPLGQPSGGRPLDPALRRDMEASLGAPLPETRIHDHPAAGALAEAMGANAVTHGRDVYFRSGRFATTTRAGRELLAHELIHVVQQQTPASVAGPLVSSTDGVAETEARAGADRVARGAPPIRVSSAPGGWLQLDRASDLISSHTSWYGNLDEAALGAALHASALAGDHDFVQRVLDTLGSTDRDDVSLELMKRATDPQLDTLAATVSGRALISRLYDELTSGYVSDEESAQADRIIRAKGRATTEAEFTARAENAKVFPYRLPGLTVIADALIMAAIRPGGRVWVKQPTRTLGIGEFAEETRTLPVDVFIGGIELPEDEIVGVRMYDLGGEVRYRPALYLVQLANETDRVTAEKVGEAVALGLTVGSGALLEGGASLGARVLLWADRVLFALQTVTSVLREHRGWIIQRWGDDGRRFVHALEIFNSALAVLGIARAGIAVGQAALSLRSAYQSWRGAANAAEGSLSNAERQAVGEIQRSTDRLLEEANQRPPGIPGEPAPAAPPGRPATPGEPAGAAPGAAEGAPRAGAPAEAEGASLRARPPAPSGEIHEPVLASWPTADGHTIRVTASGRVFRCTSCQDILHMLDDFKHVFAERPDLLQRLERVEGLAELAATLRRTRSPNAAAAANDAASEASLLWRDVRRAHGVRREIAESTVLGHPAPARPAVPAGLPAERASEGLRDLARWRASQTPPLPAAGSAADTYTVARLDVGGRSFYGKSAQGTPVDLVVSAQSIGHAETHAIQGAARAGVNETRGVLFVDRELCHGCGDLGAVQSMARQLGLLQLDVYTPSGYQAAFSFRLFGR
jgi:hypothetical protein